MNEDQLLKQGVKPCNDESSEKEYKWYYIDKTMISSKLFYLTRGAKTSCFEPYMVIFFISIGLDPSKAGLIGGIRLIGAILGGPLWAFIADLKHIHQLIIIITCICAIISMLVQPFLSLMIGEEQHNKCPIDSTSSNTTMRVANSTDKLINGSKPKDNINLFYTLMLVNIVANLFDGAHKVLTDYGVIEKCKQSTRKAEYGKQRLFGAIGYGIGVLLSNFGIEYFPKSKLTCYTGMVIVYCVLTFLYMIVGIIVFRDHKIITSVTNKKENLLKTLIKTISQLDVVIFLLTTLIMGVLQSFYTSFTVLVLKDLNAPLIINGVSIAVAAFSCIITFYTGEMIILKLGGKWNTMAFTCFCYFVRYILVAYLRRPWLMPLIQLFQSFCYGLFMLTAVTHIRDISPPSILTTMYGLFNAIHFGISIILANVFGGYIYKYYKAQFLFKIASYGTLCWTVVLVLYIFLRYYQQKKTQMNVKKQETEMLCVET